MRQPQRMISTGRAFRRDPYIRPIAASERVGLVRLLIRLQATYQRARALMEKNYHLLERSNHDFAESQRRLAIRSDQGRS
jgi:hypothetical protein